MLLCILLLACPVLLVFAWAALCLILPLRWGQKMFAAPIDLVQAWRQRRGRH